jgi:hypothetical protein
LDGRIPEEEWTGKKVNYSFLKTFSWSSRMKMKMRNLPGPKKV